MGLSGILPRPRKRTSTSKGATLGQVIAFANQKGGVAKTTTTLNLAVAFKEHGFEVLIVDLDPQGNLTMSQGMDPDQVERSMYDVLVHSMPVEEVVHRARRRRARSVEHDRARARPAEGAAPGAQPL